jgi:hypothetical protein
MPVDACNLSQEVQVLHQQLFRSPAPLALIDQYLRFHAESPALVQATPQELRTVATIVHKRLDALGIEPWLRGGAQRHLLSRKLLLIAYLGECDAEHLGFRQAVSGRLPSCSQLCGAGVLGVWHLLTGRLQKAMHGLL